MNNTLKLLTLILATSAMPASAEELVEPRVFSSDKITHELNILMIAKAAPINFKPNVNGWVYDICTLNNSTNNQSACAVSTDSGNLYGGSRLQVNAGDTLKIHFVNQLPMIQDSDSDDPYLPENPTNIHTHGMLVSPTFSSPTYGDDIYVATTNPLNGTLTPDDLHGATINSGSTDYAIKVPENHPSGLFWIHPHVHGIALNQVSAGLAGIITVGNPGDSVFKPGNPLAVRHLILKDVQISGGNRLKDQEDPSFCTQPSNTPGSCNGDNGDQWFFSINGQLNPTITVDAGGQVWRLTNASGSATYQLQLNKGAGNALSANGMAMQLLAIDGISATPATGPGPHTLGRGKYLSTPCPGVPAAANAVCISQLHMMPGTRAEVWVVNRDDSGKMTQAGGSAVLQTIGYATGIDADNWPAIKLAQVSFSGAGAMNNLPVLTVKNAGLNFQSIAQNLLAANKAVGASNHCPPLPAGWKRRIFFGYPTPSTFGLGIELVDKNGNAVNGTFQDVAAFPSANTPVCLPLGAANSPVYENWEIVNLTDEDHNFHIHQTKFTVTSTEKPAGAGPSVNSNGIYQDSAVLLAGSEACDGSVAAWRSGACKTAPVEVNIPFAIAGDFVYHCHILEHEDGGMMAAIHVAANPGK